MAVQRSYTTSYGRVILVYIRQLFKIFTGHRIIVAAACAAVSPDTEVFWYVDVLARIITGKYPIGVAKYVEKKGNTFGTSLDSYPPLVFYANMHSLYSFNW